MSSQSVVFPNLYYRTSRAKITIRDLSGDVTLHEYNPFLTGSSLESQSLKILNAKCTPSLNHVGTFDIEILDPAAMAGGGPSSLNLDTIDQGKRVFFDISKDGITYQRIFSGRIEAYTPARNSKDDLVWHIDGYGSGIRLNERVTNFFREAKRLGVGTSTQADPSDETMQAYRLLEDLFQDTDHLPLGEPLETMFDTSELANSGVTDFIASIRDQLVEWMSVKQVIEDYSGAYIFVDQNDRVRIQYPNLGGNGFTLKSQPNYTQDMAATTAYFTGTFGYAISTKKQDGYANRIFSVVTARDTLDSSEASLDQSSATKVFRTDICQKFSPTSPTLTDVSLTLSRIGDIGGSKKLYVEIQKDTGGNRPNGKRVISGSLPIKDIQKEEAANYKLKFDQTQPIGGVVDIGSDYWLIVAGKRSSEGHTENDTILWHHDGNTIVGNSGTRTPDKIPRDNSGWDISSSGPTYGYATFGSKAIMSEASDSRAIAKRGLVEAAVSDLQYLNDVESMDVAMHGIIQVTSKPRIIYQSHSVTIPDIPIMPADPVQIIDDKLNFGVTNQPKYAEVVECEYNFTSAMLGANTLTLQVIGYMDTY